MYHITGMFGRVDVWRIAKLKVHNNYIVSKNVWRMNRSQL